MKILDFCLEIIYICRHIINQNNYFMKNFTKFESSVMPPPIGASCGLNMPTPPATHTHTHTRTHTRFRKNKPVLFLILMAMFSVLKLNAQTLDFEFSTSNVYSGDTLFIFNTSTGFSDSTIFIFEYLKSNGGHPKINETLFESKYLKISDTLKILVISSGTFNVKMNVLDTINNPTSVQKNINIQEKYLSCSLNHSNCNAIRNRYFSGPQNRWNHLFWADCWDNASLVGGTYNPWAGADYYSTLAPIGSPYRIPNTQAGYQQSVALGRMVGFVAYIQDNINSQIPYPDDFARNYREYPTTRIINPPLISGQLYYASMDVSLAETSKIAVKNIGMYFGWTSAQSIRYDGIHTIPQIIPKVPQIVSQTIVNNTTDWIRIEGEFVSTGGNCLHIGNFSNDQDTEIQVLEGNQTFQGQYVSYYFLDNVQLKPIHENTNETISYCHTSNLTISTKLHTQLRNTFLWNTGATTASITVNPTVTTNYSVTSTDVYGCTKVDSYTIVPVQNPVLSNVSGPRHTCVGLSTYSITNPQQGTNYTWSIEPSNSNYGSFVGSNVGTTVSINWDESFFSDIEPVFLIIESNNTCLSRDTIKIWKCCRKGGESNLYDQTITTSLPSGDYNINGTVVFSGNFSYSNMKFIMGAESNVIIAPNAQVTFNNSEFRADCGYMWKGIELNSSARITMNNSFVSDAYTAIKSINGGRYILYNTVFNKNLVGIDVQSFSGNHLGTVSKCTFESTTDNNPSNLLNPYSNRRGETGIKITNVNNIQIGNTASTANKNVFKHLDYGVYIDNSNVTLYNNSFGPMPSTSGFIPENGYGVYASSSLSNNTLNIGSTSTNTIFSNSFSDCAVGIYSRYDYSLNIRRNKFNNSSYACLILDDLNRNVNFTHNTLNKGQIGFWINNFAGTSVNVLNNTFDNVPYSIFLSNNVPTFITSVNVAHNTIQMGLNTAVTGGDMVNGIILSNVKGYNSFYTGEVRPYIYNNDIKFNTVNLGLSTVRSGVLLENSPMTLVELNRISYKNAGITTLQADRLNGVNVILSTNVVLCSNELKHLANGVRVEGFCDNSRFIKNNFKRFSSGSLNQSYGFKFVSATIGVQGTPTQTWDNEFDNMFLPGSPNRGVGSIALQQQWNYKSNDNKYLYRMTYEQIANTLHSGRNIFSTITCGQQGGFFMNGFSGNNEISLDSESEFLENDAENKYFKAYTLLNSESSFNESEAMLSSNISSSIDVENISKFSEVNHLVKDRLFDSADSLNQLIDPVNLIEKNMKTVNEIYLRTWAKGNYNLSLQDYTTLVDIAMQTPKTSGYGVIGAWVMVGRFDNTQETEKFSNNKINIISNNILMYPNPATSQLSFEGTESVAQIFIHDVMGRLVRVIDNQQLDNAISISISDLKKGIYIVTYTNELKEKVSFEKLTIN